jgi:hypothetical protein
LRLAKHSPITVSEGGLVLVLTEGHVERVALLLLVPLSESIDRGLEHVFEHWARPDVVFVINVLAMHFGLNITILTVSKPGRAIITTSSAESLTTSTRAAAGKASSKAATPETLLKVDISKSGVVSMCLREER